ncbi:Radical SAM domain protein [Desulfofarcimen acetoxidans DSM 771]|uniref:Radical SAM domain protein n=1 Tax=Desulfofarcimen acetoxidans (strain ATCC 49208 / DSM 771 / KCTC 5769 / VKM B-1644 / 5575) TaxID=485916 RepID=C8VVF8_DESAS|nr:radical SAM protein [Desulfofarcimen acetoxidans]ACV61024.1 Radical SAM domain protein [Desulfofarcimen acetoxidans DSM 771]
MYKLLYADQLGRLYVDQDLLALGRSGEEYWEISEDEMLILPPGADLMLLPGRSPVGLNSDGEPEILECMEDGSPVCAVAAVLPAGYTRLLLPGYENSSHNAPVLPLYGYTAVGVDSLGQICVAAILTDPGEKWNPLNYNDDFLSNRIEKKRYEFPGNRIIEQLAVCSMNYHCLTAQNLFYERWEAGLPASPACNARCLGCISLQPSECCPSPQSRINFTPSVSELVELAAAHLSRASEAIVSGGQGCEGEPLMAYAVWSQAIKEIRRITNRGTLNINTNGGFTRGLDKLCDAGLDSIRVSLFSARTASYRAYHCPVDYDLDDVKRSLLLAKSYGVYISLNLLVFPGITDREEEMNALINLINEYNIDMVQLRNLNIDPDMLIPVIGGAASEVLGIGQFIDRLKRDCRHLIIGSFSHPVSGR